MPLYNSIKFVVNVILVILIGIILGWFYREYKIKKLNHRLGKYSIKAKKSYHKSLFDQIIGFYNNLENIIIKRLSKSKKIVEYSKNYDKYIDKRKSKLTGMNTLAFKIICSFVSLLIIFISTNFQNDNFDILSIVLALIFGYLLPDLLLISQKYVVKKEMENDLLQAITIMNNSFKSGRSIMQTINIVGDELEGPLKNEFKQMVVDLNYGLTIEDVFKRLEERVKIDDVKYISTSLSILNKTGGNIVKVFGSIEKTFFNNKKLDEELKNLSSQSKFLYHILELIPIIFVLIIYILDPSYFNPLFNNILGIIIIILVLLIYISYIFIVCKLINIKEYL